MSCKKAGYVSESRGRGSLADLVQALKLYRSQTWKPEKRPASSLLVFTYSLHLLKNHLYFLFFSIAFGKRKDGGKGR